MICAIFSVSAMAAGDGEGSGNAKECPWCDGTGSIPCEDCGGQGDCESCESTGLAACEDCGGTGEVVKNYGTFLALIPPIVAIGLALITKEVYSSLFIGIVVGTLLFANFNIELAANTLLNTSLIGSIADVYNVGILIFLAVLGMIVVLMNRAGGSAAYGQWASERISSRRGALGATFGLGCLIFVDDYFNCLTVGSVMRPVTDKFNISRAKLAYFIDATAAPICMIAPISSWAAAVSGTVEGYNGFEIFVRAIPYNFYSLLTIVMVIFMIVTKFDFGPMATHERNALKGDLYTTAERPYAAVSDEKGNPKGKVIDLVLPVVVLIISCILGMVYTGGLFSGVSIMDAFANCDASVGLSMGSLIALIIVIVYFVCRRVLSFKDCMGAIPDGFKAMVPAILILIFAWTLKSTTGLLGAPAYVKGIVDSVKALQVLLPAIVFVIGVGLSFATGTSWGTFGILIPIVVAVFPQDFQMLIIAISACLAGAVCGDHCSPISDTTIMASTGAQCDHLNHVTTQIPYAMTVAAVSLVSYIITGFVKNIWISLPIAIILMVATLMIIRSVVKRKECCCGDNCDCDCEK